MTEFVHTDIIGRRCEVGSPAYESLVAHGTLVARKALSIARRLGVGESGLEFVEEAALLHDIGMLGTRAKGLHCYGDAPYIAHGVIGRRMLEAEGLPRHALVCERHVGMGLLATEIAAKGLPLPEYDMFPLTLEERIICFADKFFSKGGDNPGREKDVGEVREKVASWGERSLGTFDQWAREFQEGPA